LTDVIREKAGCDIWKDFPAIYDGGRAFIASFAECVFRAREMGDITARRIFNRCASDLSDLIWAAYKDLGGPYDLILNGGIFRNFPEYADVVRAQSPKDVRMILSDIPPIYGCAVEAMHDLGLTCDENFKKNFMASYK
jgi:N-acetylglucosamine kinase-like BadF-type ATPase